MTIFDGENGEDGQPTELTLGQALVEIANRITWPSEAHGKAIRHAVQDGYGLRRYDAVPEETPEQKAAREQAETIARLEKQLAEMQAAQQAQAVAAAEAAAEAAAKAANENPPA